ncbi:MAG: hypothetical protein LUI13_01880, partial [Lachnospiraceae bacterium]|nr:hypothetical protein [Lachnospiraceae bacterium]
MKKKLVWGSILVCLILLFAAWIYRTWENDREVEAEVRGTYQQAEELIEQGLYEEADELLETIRGLQYTELEINKLLSLCEAHMSYDDGDLTS